MSDLTILTTRARVEALVRMLDHDHISYSEEGALVRAFLHDAEASLSSKLSADMAQHARARLLDVDGALRSVGARADALAPEMVAAEADYWAHGRTTVAAARAAAPRKTLYCPEDQQTATAPHGDPLAVTLEPDGYGHGV